MTSSQEPLGQIQPSLVENMFWGWGFRFVQIKGRGHQRAPQGAKKGDIWQILKKSSS